MAQGKGENQSGKPAPKGKAAKNQGKNGDKSSFLFVLTLIVIGVVVIVLSFLFLRDSEAPEATSLKDLPNYTEIKGDYEAQGLKYEKQPHLGNPEAKVKVMEFADFKCPACMEWEAAYMDQLQQEFIDTGKVEFFFTNYAFIDRDSIMAASAGEAIAAQSNEKFWEFKKKLFANQGDETKIWATPEFLLDFTKKHIDGIDYEQFARDLQDHTYMLAVKEDFKTAGYYGVNGTPQFMVNGELLPSSSYEELVAAIEAALAAEGEQ